MKKYLKDLEEELRKNNLSEKEIKEILADHEEMIETAKNEGLSEEELNEKFGNPKDVAEELSDFSEQADESEEEEKEANSKTFEFTGVKEGYKVNISLINEDVKVITNEGDKITLEVIGISNVKKYDIGFENNEFFLKAPTGLRFNYFSGRKEQKFIVNLPKAITVGEFRVKLVNGDAKIKNIVSEMMELGTNNGDFKLKNLETKQLKLSNINGDVSIESVKCDNLKVSTISGDLEIKDLKVKEDFFANTVSGDVKINDSECRELSLKTVSGDVKGDEFYPQKLSLSSVSGDVKIVNSDEDRKVIVLKKRSVSGDIRLILKEKK